MKFFLCSILTILLFCVLGAAPLALENEFLVLEVNPTGGRIQRLALKTHALELTSGEGLLGDNFHNIPTAHFFLTGLPYTASTSPDSLTLQTNHRGGGIDFMDLQKRIELHPAETSVHVHYTFHNLAASMATVEYGFWSQNFIGQPKQEKNCFFPCMNGIMQVPSQHAGASFVFYKKPSRGWLGFTTPDGGGLAMAMDYSLINQFYGWYGKGETTQEFYCEPFKLAQDQSRTETLELIAFHTLKHISGAGGGLVGDMSLIDTDTPSEKSLSLALYSSKIQDIRLVFSARRLRDGKPVQFAEKSVQFTAPATIHNLKLNHDFKANPAIFDVEARAFSPDGKLLAIFNAPLGIGTSTLAYRMLPELQRNHDKGPQIDLTMQESSLKTDGMVWTRPMAGGKLRITALTPYQSYPDVARLAASLDAELNTTLYLSQGRPQNATGDYFGLLSEADISDNIDALLQRPCDVMLIAGVNFGKLNAAQREEILSRVKAGCGLVLIGCSGQLKELEELNPLAAATPRSYPSAQPVKTRESTFTTAVPWKLFPHAVCIPYTAAGDVLATISGLPYLVVRQVGKGNVASLPWLTSGGSGRMVGGLMPNLPWPVPDAPYRDYPECYRLLLAKMLVAVAGRDKSMHFTAVDAKHANGQFTVTIGLEAIPENSPACTLTLFTRNGDGEELSRKEFTFSPKSSQQFSLPATPWNAPVMLGLILRNSSGQVTDFGAIAAQCPTSLRLLSLTADKPHYQEGEQASFTLKAAVDAPGTIAWELRDAFDRTVQAATLPAAPELTVTIPVTSSLRSRNYTFIAEARLNGHTVGRRRLLVTATPANAQSIWNDYQVGLWITPHSHDATREYLHGDLAKVLRSLHVTTIMGNERSVDLDFALKNNFTPTIYRSNGTHPSAVPADYHKSHDKMLLKRSPCLSAPDLRSSMQQTFAELGKTFADKGIGYYWFGDELSLTGYWSTPVDFCFSSSCLQGFATFMQQKYTTIQAANAQWNTSYSRFSEFIPDSLDEARAHKDGNYSAWADHLEYMDGLLADYVTFFTGKNALRKDDPNARSFISGPQGPSAYGGNNWAIQGPAYSGLMSYSNGGLQEILHSFAPNTLDMPWILGYANTDATVCYNLWRSLQLRCRGAMAFSSSSVIRRDYSLAASGQAAANYLPEIMEGMGKLFITTLKDAPPAVEILYSQPSIRAAFITGRAKVHEEIRLQYQTLCRNLGIPFRFISEADILHGHLAQEQPKLLILPDSAALSDDALAHLQDFMARGGTILADGVFADMDASCRKRPERKPLQHDRLLRRDSSSAHYHDASRKPAATRETNDRNTLEHCRNDFAAILKQADITPVCTLRKNDGTPFLDAETAVFTDAQNNTFVLAITMENSPVTVSAEFARKTARVINVRNASLELKNDNPLLFALLDTPVSAPPELKVTANGRRFMMECNMKEHRNTVLRLTVRNPSGSLVGHYCANLDAPDGTCRHPLELALNDAKGTWSVEVRDVVTGRTASTTFTAD